MAETISEILKAVEDIINKTPLWKVEILYVSPICHEQLKDRLVTAENPLGSIGSIVIQRDESLIGINVEARVYFRISGNTHRCKLYWSRWENELFPMPIDDPTADSARSQTRGG